MCFAVKLAMEFLNEMRNLALFVVSPFWQACIKKHAVGAVQILIEREMRTELAEGKIRLYINEV